MHIEHLKKEVDALKVQVAELKEKGVGEVLASTLNDFNNRLIALEIRATEAGI